jgi:hypothetical protein
LHLNPNSLKMNKFCILFLALIILITKIGFTQNSTRNIINQRKISLSGLNSGDFYKYAERTNINETISDKYIFLTFNEYWMINHLGKKKILLADYYNQKSLKQSYTLINDSLSRALYSIAKENELDLKSTIDEIYKDKAEHTINELFLDMLLSHSNNSIKSFKEKRDKIIEEIKYNEKEYPDSIFDLIQYQDIKNRLNLSGSIELKKFTDHKFYDTNKLIKRNYGLSFSLSGPIFLRALYQSLSFDINLIQSFDQKYAYTKPDINVFYVGGYEPKKYYLDEYSETSIVKATLGLSYSLGFLLINNQSFNTSLSWFLSAFTIKNSYGYYCTGFSLASNIYLPKYYQNQNINGCINRKKALKISVNYDIINKQVSIGVGISLNKITQLNFLNTNSMF